MSAVVMSDSPLLALPVKPELPAGKLMAGGLAIGFHLLMGALLLLNWQAPMPPAPPPASIRIAMIVAAPQPVAESVTAAPEALPKKAETPRPLAPPRPERAELAHKRVKPEPKPMPETAPPAEPQQETHDDTVQREQVEAQRQAAEQRAREAAEQTARMRQREAERLAASRQYLPVEKKAPAYPQRALDKGIEGSCTVSYTVNAMGRVEQPQVVGECHPLFIRPSLEAARGFRYEPRVIDGRAVAVPDVKNTFQYRIAQGAQ